jgi:8-oxo-dGTP pyrophosphatase MutT (NUDIX family)
MSYLDRIAACNTYDLAAFIPLVVDDVAVGWIHGSNVAALTGKGSPLIAKAERISFAPGNESPEERSAAIAKVAPAWVQLGLVPKLRREIYPVRRFWSDADFFRIDRALAQILGCRAFGVHLNGYVKKNGGTWLWIGRRNSDRMIEPNKLDNMVAGGQPADLGIEENLFKECEEEAGMPASLAQNAMPAGTVTYAFEGDRGLKVDTLFCYDLDVPEDFTPQNRDGEILDFHLMPVEEVLALIEAGPAFKFNVSLVILDFAIRHGLITPDKEPDYERILAGLHAPPPDSAGMPR